jgi:hypothetical protein
MAIAAKKILINLAITAAKECADSANNNEQGDCDLQRVL